MLWLTVRNYLVPHSTSRYTRGVELSDVVITGFDCIFKVSHQVHWVLRVYGHTSE
jgi:hypothetical protein